MALTVASLVFDIQLDFSDLAVFGDGLQVGQIAVGDGQLVILGGGQKGDDHFADFAGADEQDFFHIFPDSGDFGPHNSPISRLMEGKI